MKIKQLMINVNNRIIYWSYKFYIENRTVVPSDIYDKYCKLLLKLEKENGYRLKNSMTQWIGPPTASMVYSRSEDISKNDFYTFKQEDSIDFFVATENDDINLKKLRNSLINFGGISNSKSEIDVTFNTEKGNFRILLHNGQNDIILFDKKTGILTIKFSDKGKTSHNEILLIKMPKILRNVNKLIKKYKGGE